LHEVSTLHHGTTYSRRETSSPAVTRHQPGIGAPDAALRGAVPVAEPVSVLPSHRLCHRGPTIADRMTVTSDGGSGRSERERRPGTKASRWEKVLCSDDPGANGGGFKYPGAVISSLSESRWRSSRSP
jgi:hypothetical protein